MSVWDRLSQEANQRLGQTGGLPDWTELGRQVVMVVVVFLVVVYLAVGALFGGDSAPPTTTVASGPAVTVVGPVEVTTTTVTAAGSPVVDAAGEPASVDPAAVAAIEDAVAAEFGPDAEILRVTVTVADVAGSPVDATVDVDDPSAGIVAFGIAVAETATGWEEVTNGGPAGP